MVPKIREILEQAAFIVLTLVSLTLLIGLFFMVTLIYFLMDATGGF